MNTNQTFIQSVQDGNTPMVKELLQSDPGLAKLRTDTGLSLVLLATYYGHPDMARMLADSGLAIDIFEACALGRQERVVELLLSDPSLAMATSTDGFSPLGLACFFGHVGVVDVLLAAGAPVNVASQNAMRVMPLHSAVAGGSHNLAIARALVEHGADVNARQEGGFTPLMEAAQNGDVETLELLVQHGADCEATTTDGRTALDLAVKEGHTAVIAMLNKSA